MNPDQRLFGGCVYTIKVQGISGFALTLCILINFRKHIGPYKETF